MFLSKPNLILSLMGLYSFQQANGEDYANIKELAMAMDLMRRRNLKGSTNEVIATGRGEIVDQSFAKGRKLVGEGLTLYSNADDFKNADGGAGNVASEYCEYFQMVDFPSVDPILGTHPPYLKCSDNPLSSSALGGCFISLKPGFSIGSTTKLASSFYNAVPPIAVILPAFAAAMNFQGQPIFVAPGYTIDNTIIKFSQGAHAVSFSVADANAGRSVKIEVFGADGYIGTMASGSSPPMALGHVGLISTTPIQTIKITTVFDPLLADGGTGQADVMEWVDNLCFTPPDYTGGSMDDPHFLTWAGDWYDFMGACDLVLVHAPNFDLDTGLELNVNIRTKTRLSYSYIESTVIKMGEDFLEVRSFGQYSYQGVENACLEGAQIAGFNLTHVSPSENLHFFEIDLGNNEKIVIKTFKDMVSVKLDKADLKRFRGSQGMLGEFGTGRLLGRNGTVVSDPNALASEWQVQESEPMLFQTDRAPQHPAACELPGNRAESRRLGASIDREIAEEACAHWPLDRIAMCVEDIIATGDVDLAGAGAF